MLAYLVIREGSKWTDVFRLIPGRTVTIGRAPTNNIVVQDERCSRHHAEIFSEGGSWTLRDLQSRNGTAIGKDRIEGDRALLPGEVVRIAGSQMAFVDDLTTAFSDSGKLLANLEQSQDTLSHTDSHVFESGDTQTITHRKGETRFLKRESGETAPAVAAHGAATLYRLAIELAGQPNLKSMAKTALDGLLDYLPADAGAIHYSPTRKADPTPQDLEIIHSHSGDKKAKYHRPTSLLMETVFREGEAIIARNVAGDSTIATRDSHGLISATSLICAPIRQNKKVVGLIHLYSTNAEKVAGPEELEFTLAVAENLAVAIRNLARQQELADNLNMSLTEVAQLRERLGAESQIIGSSRAIEGVHREIARAAPSRATVLVRGESGVGKELVARAIHYMSNRAKGPFVCLNCAALSETLLESELFGHEKGAFTGATDRKIGKFEAADRGTLMLDEIGEMSAQIQSKFLRVLEGHAFERVGGNRSIKVDVRVIAATNRHLETAVSEGSFRRDLYFRLRVLEIVVPPLRKRPEDILLLAEHFLNRFSGETGRRINGFTDAAIKRMEGYHWPGNVREMKNVIERAVVLAADDVIDAAELHLSQLSGVTESTDSLPRLPEISPAEPTLASSSSQAHDDSRLVPSANSDDFQPISLAEMERIHIAATLDALDWNKSRTAAALGIERSTLDRKIRRYEIHRPAPKPE